MRRSTWLLLGAAVAIGVLVAVFSGASTRPPAEWGDEPPARRGGPPSGKAGEAVVVLLDETNSDTFRDSLGIEDGDDEEAAVRWEGDRLLVREDLLEATDARALEEAGVSLADPAVPLARCALVVVHRVAYAGKGRHALRTRVHGFPGGEGSVPLGPGAPAGEEWTVDPAEVPSGLAGAAEGIRLFEAESISLRSEGSGVAVAYGEKRRTVAAGERWALGSRESMLRVVEKGVGWDEVDLDGADPASLPEEFLPRVDHGAVTFRTELALRCVGEVAVAAPVDEVGLEEDR